MKAAPAVAFDVRPSRMLVLATIAVTALALGAAALTEARGWVHVGVFGAVAGVGAAAVARLLRPRLAGVAWRPDDSVDIRLREDDRSVAGSLHSARVLGPLIVLSLRWPVRDHAHLWLLPDNVDAETRRRLRMRLGARSSAPTSGNADSG